MHVHTPLCCWRTTVRYVNNFVGMGGEVNVQGHTAGPGGGEVRAARVHAPLCCWRTTAHYVNNCVGMGGEVHVQGHTAGSRGGEVRGTRVHVHTCTAVLAHHIKILVWVVKYMSRAIRLAPEEAR